MERHKPPQTVKTIAYGPAEHQQGDLYLPANDHPPVLCLLHGGFWRVPHGREQMDPIARDLCRRGFAVWNLRYRRIGEAGGGWPGTLVDVLAAVDHLETITREGIDLDLTRVGVAGHSAGGHLALLVAAYSRKQRNATGTAFVRLAAAIGLAPVVDLASAYVLDAGNGAVREFIGGSPQQYPERYAAASPFALMPLGVPQLILHGTADDAVPIEPVREYAALATARGDAVELIELPGIGHMDFLDPASAAHGALRGWLERHFSPPAAA